MANYSKRTCHNCGIRLPQPEMIAKTIQVETGNSRKTLSGTELIFAVFGNRMARRAVGRTFTSPNKRRYVRNKDVWECYKCAGVETQEEKLTRLENERIAKESDLKAKISAAEQKEHELQMRLLEQGERRSLREAEKRKRREQKAERAAASRRDKLSNGSFYRLIIAFLPQFLLSLFLIYIPLTEFYLRRFRLSILKFVGFYSLLLTILVIISNGEDGSTSSVDMEPKSIIFILTVPVAIGIIDLISGFRFFRGQCPGNMPNKL